MVMTITEFQLKFTLWNSKIPESEHTDAVARRPL